MGLQCIYKMLIKLTPGWNTLSYRDSCQRNQYSIHAKFKFWKLKGRLLPRAPLSHFQVGVKSVAHWLQVNGMGWTVFSLFSCKILPTHSSRPSRQMNSVLAGLGMKCISGGGGLGGGIWKKQMKTFILKFNLTNTFIIHRAIKKTFRLIFRHTSFQMNVQVRGFSKCIL